jgi:hypothetical protein
MFRHTTKCISLFELMILLLFANVSRAQEEPESEEQPSVVDLALGALKTEAEAAAIRLAINFVEELPDIFKASGPQSKAWLVDLRPEVTIETGTADSFNAIIAKLTGNYIRFPTTVVGGVVVPDGSRLFHAFPLSMGLETDRSFRTVSAIAEVGYVPFYLKQTRFKLGLNPKLGIFLQSGYKFSVSEVVNSGDVATVDDCCLDDIGSGSNGSKDESEEAPDSGLLRMKGVAEFQVPIVKIAGGERGLSFVGRAAGWYDIANGAFYHKLVATVRLSVSSDRHFDFTYEKGSGAPNFNKGAQFSANLAVEF